MAKFKCNEPDCGHIFEGDLYTTTNCPQCGSTDISQIRGGFSQTAKRIIAAIVIAIIIILLLKVCNGCDNSICGELNTNGETIVATFTMKNGTQVDNNTYRVKVYDEDGFAIDSLIVKNGKASFPKITFDTLGEGLTFYFKLCLKDGTEPKCKWQEGGNKYTTPETPKRPIISVAHHYDYVSKMYDISIKVKSGTPHEFSLCHYEGNNLITDKKQTDSVFLSIAPTKTRYYVFLDDENGLRSDTILVPLLVAKEPLNFDGKKIQYVFNEVADKKIMPGDAIAKIGDNNIKLSRAIDGCETLEDALNYAYRNKKKYIVQAKLSQDDCSTKIISLTLK